MSAKGRAALHVHKHRPASSERARWVRMLESARDLAKRARGSTAGAGLAPMEACVADLQLLMRGAAAQGFPTVIASDAKGAEAFLACGTAFAGAAGERRERWASPLEALATALMDSLHELRSAEAAASHGRYMDRD